MFAMKYIFLISFFFAVTTLFAETPLTDWRQSSDPMLAETGGYTSLYSNPAGIVNPDKPKETVIGIVPFMNLGFSSASPFIDAIAGATNGDISAFDPIIAPFISLTSLGALGGGDASSINDTAGFIENTFRNMDQSTWDLLAAGTPLAVKTPSSLTAEDFADLDSTNLDRLANNAKSISANTLSKSFAKSITRSLEEVKGMHAKTYLLPFDFGAVYQSLGGLPLVFAWSGRPLAVKTALAVGGSAGKTTFKPKATGGFDFEVDIPIIIQAYTETTARFGFGFQFPVLKGLKFGVSPYFSYIVGISEQDIAGYLSNYSTEEFLNIVYDPISIIPSFMKISWGIDAGVLYNFGFLYAPLKFLSVGMTIRDLIGFTHPLSGNNFQKARYNFNIDLGVYAEHSFLAELVTIYGGIDILEFRGFFDEGRSPLSTLDKPIDHFRFKVGTAFLAKAIKIDLQYYDGFFSPGVDFTIGPFNIGGQFDIGENEQIGGSFHMLFRFPATSKK